MAIPIGKESDIKILERFTSSKEQIFAVDNISRLQDTLVGIFNEALSSFTGKSSASKTSPRRVVRPRRVIEIDPDRD